MVAIQPKGLLYSAVCVPCFKQFYTVLSSVYLILVTLYFFPCRPIQRVLQVWWEDRGGGIHFNVEYY